MNFFNIIIKYLINVLQNYKTSFHLKFFYIDSNKMNLSSRTYRLYDRSKYLTTSTDVQYLQVSMTKDIDDCLVPAHQTPRL